MRTPATAVQKEKKTKEKEDLDLQNADSQSLLILKAIVISYITF